MRGAVFPATGDADRPTAVVLVDKDDWQAGVAASVLAGPPIGAPLLLSDGDELPAVTEDTLERLDPKGSDLSKDAQVIRIGPDVRRARRATRRPSIEGDDPVRARGRDRPLLLCRHAASRPTTWSSTRASSREYAMPAAAWAARSGDAVLPVRARRDPRSVRDGAKRHEKPDVFSSARASVIAQRGRAQS